MLIASLYLFIVGLSFGSFVNALVWRIYQSELPAKKRAASSHELSIVTGRSMCPHCKHSLSAFDLVPVLSWLFLKGKCRYCKHPIGWQYPLVELVTSLMFVASYEFWPAPLEDILSYAAFTLWLVILVGLVALVVYDIRWMLLPNRIVFPLILLAVVFAGINIVQNADYVNDLINVGASLAVASGIFYVLFQLSDGRWIGGGDVKLGIILGLLLATPLLSFLMLFFASLIGLLFALPGVIGGRGGIAQKIIPFGPSLIIATVICTLFGQSIINWYGHQVLMF